jgi:signal transduction histidine kinase
MIQDEIWRSEKPATLSSLKNQEVLRRHWGRTVLRDESRLYAAVVDSSGVVIAHSNPAQEGMKLGPAWYSRVLPEIGDDVVETQNEAIAGGRHGFDVQVPIYINDQEVGTYHSALSYDWLAKRLAEKRTETLRVWVWVFACIVIVVTVAGFSLFQISRRMVVIREAIKLSRARRFAEIGQIMTGIAHEIRNPLNAMRLNLHVLSRQQQPFAGGNGNGTELSVDQGQIIRETNQEIERVEGLMRILLGYARPDQPHNENLDVQRELQSTLNFLGPVLERGEILVRVHYPEMPAFVHIDRDRLRQIVLNLVNNARDATGPGGTIVVSVTRQSGWVEIAVADDGPGVPAGERERIFEPFFSTKEMGTGLGLAIVRRYVEDVGGTIVCTANTPRGARMEIRLREVLEPVEAPSVSRAAISGGQ